MNKLLWLPGIIVSLGLTSCTTGKIAQQHKKEFLDMKGEWEITNINYDASKFKLKPFGDGADIQCWIGSSWKLTPNNWTGSYTLHGKNSCPSFTQPIKFDVQNGDTFVFKKINEGVKAKQNTSGYMLTIVSKNDHHFSLKQTIPFDGEMIEVVYNFQKISK